MNVLLLDTNVVSILFKPDHELHGECLSLASGSQLFISFMTKAELEVWPKQNDWGPKRAAKLKKHVGLCTTLFPDEKRCSHWAKLVSDGRSAGRPVTTADAWIAATAIQWELPLVTADYRDFEYIDGLTLVPVR